METYIVSSNAEDECITGSFDACWFWLQGSAPDGSYSIRCAPFVDLAYTKTDGNVVPDVVKTRFITVTVAAFGRNDPQIAAAIEVFSS